MDFSDKAVLNETRRQFFARGARGIGSIALGSLLAETLGATNTAVGGLPGLPHFPPKAKRAIYLHMLGAPPQMETFDYKPRMQEWFDKDLPESIRQGQRLTTMTSGQTRFPIAPSVFKFAQYGKSGAWISELLPYTAKMVDDIAIIRTMHTEAINHEPAITYLQTGFMIAGKPCIGSWIAYGLGSMDRDLPTFVVLNATHSHPKANVQAISARLWSAGFLSGKYSGVALRSGGDPVLYINNPDGVPSQIRRRMLDALGELNHIESEKVADPETLVRIEQYEMAFRMQSSVPDLTDLTKEPESTFKLYGEDARKGGTFANNCLMARRLIERDVRFVQVYHRGWDVHCDFAGSAAEPVPGCGSRRVGAGAGFEGARALGRYAGDFWRGIRAHDLLTGQTDADRLWAGPSSALFLDLDGGGGDQGRGGAWGDGRVFVQHRKRSGACARFSGDDSESVRDRS